MACGSISHARTIVNVEITTVSQFDIISFICTVNIALQKVHVKSILQRRKFPCLRTGIIFCAYFLSDGDPLLLITVSSDKSKLIKPKFSPDISDDRSIQTTESKTAPSIDNRLLVCV